jgi:superfamily I DNA/RNA helicase
LAADPNWHTVKLEQNYRSTIPIIRAANALIKHNKQTEKKLTSDKMGVAVEYREPADDEAEITEIVWRLKNNQASGVTTAILARTNRQIDKVKSILNERCVPCETLSAATDDALQSRSAKELLAWIAAIENPQDDNAIRKIAVSKIGRLDFLQAERKQFVEGLPTLADALRNTEAGAAFGMQYQTLSHDFKEAHDIVSGITDLKLGLGIDDDRGALAIIRQWHKRQIELGEPATAAALLEWIRLRNFLERSAKMISADKTHLMTVHGSKGLEFGEVFVIGATREVFPGSGDIEEERRLFYVAITRARELLNISRPLATSAWNGKIQATEVSGFVREALV